jgi:hypothetical protein
MTLPVYGNSLSMQQIANEFSSGVVYPLNQYYSGGSYVRPGTLGYPSGGFATVIPSSGTISFNNFFGSSLQLPVNNFSRANNITSSYNFSSTIYAPISLVANNLSGLFVTLSGADSSSSPQYVGLYSTSTDGYTWSSFDKIGGSSAVANSWIQDVAVSNSGQFIAVRYPYSPQGNRASLEITTSTDGSTWSSFSQIGSNFYAQKIKVSSSGLFVIVGLNSLNNYYYSYVSSNNGSTWSGPNQINSSTTGSYPDIVDLAVNNSGLFVLLDVYGYIYTSTNGTSWSSSGVINSGYYLNWLFLTVNPSGLFVVGVQNSSFSVYKYYTYTSTNGTSWTQSTGLIGGVSGTSVPIADRIAVSNTGLFVVQGHDPNGTVRVNSGNVFGSIITFSTSTDANTWSSWYSVNNSPYIFEASGGSVFSPSGQYVAMDGFLNYNTSTRNIQFTDSGP